MYHVKVVLIAVLSACAAATLVAWLWRPGIVAAPPCPVALTRLAAKYADSGCGTQRQRLEPDLRAAFDYERDWLSSRVRSGRPIIHVLAGRL